MITIVGPQPSLTVRDLGPKERCAAPQHGNRPQNPGSSLLSLQEVDWEVELAVVIGKKGKRIKVRWKRCRLSWEMVGYYLLPDCLTLCPSLASSGD